jgi:hypothetical protein
MFYWRTESAKNPNGKESLFVTPAVPVLVNHMLAHLLSGSS